MRYKQYQISTIKSSKVDGAAKYMAGLAVGESQLRVGLIFIHIVILW